MEFRNFAKDWNGCLISNVGTSMCRGVLKLPLTGGEFAVLMDVDIAPTCYTDDTGTSRSAVATVESLLKFADRIIARYRPPVIATVVA
jgi:hypothetical protein